MPRSVESHLLAQRVTAPHRARLHLCGAVLVTAEASADGPWHRGLFPHPDPDAARRDRDRRLTQLARTGYHLVTAQRFTVPATLAMRVYQQLDVLDQPFETAWAAGWDTALGALACAVEADGTQRDHLVLLANYARHTASNPWGPTLVAALADSPQAVHAATGLLMVAVGSATLQWLHTYYVPMLEKTPPVLPAFPGDSSLTYTFALKLWQPNLDGPLGQLVAALTTGRDLSDAGVPLPDDT